MLSNFSSYISSKDTLVLTVSLDETSDILVEVACQARDMKLHLLTQAFHLLPINNSTA